MALDTATVHYHADSGDLPWPGKLDADCHSGLGLIEPPGPQCGCGHYRFHHTGDAARGLSTSCEGTAGDLDPGDFLHYNEEWPDPTLPCECTEYGEA